MTPALYKNCERAVHVVTAGGKVLRAGRASLFILERTGWSWLALLLRLPPFIWFVELCYRIVADHRPFFAKIMFTHEYDATHDSPGTNLC